MCCEFPPIGSNGPCGANTARTRSRPRRKARSTRPLALHRRLRRRLTKPRRSLTKRRRPCSLPLRRCRSRRGTASLPKLRPAIRIHFQLKACRRRCRPVIRLRAMLRRVTLRKATLHQDMLSPVIRLPVTLLRVIPNKRMALLRPDITPRSPRRLPVSGSMKALTTAPKTTPTARRHGDVPPRRRNRAWCRW